jgi:hypothetical protein
MRRGAQIIIAAYCPTRASRRRARAAIIINNSFCRHYIMAALLHTEPGGHEYQVYKQFSYL